MCCVVKANGYGHGAVQFSKLCEKNGADYLEVSNSEEAIQLRNAGIGFPILILGYTDPRCASDLHKYNISQCVFSYAYGEALAKNAVEQNVHVRIHIKLDTGKRRISFRCVEEELDLVEQGCKMQGLDQEGIFTRFVSADEDKDGKDYTLSKFMNAISY